MTRRRKIVIGTVLLAVVAGAGIGVSRWRRPTVPAVSVEAIKRRDLQALVSASGKIEPKRSVNISADTMGRVTQLAVNEGDLVKRGQFLLQIDPKSLQSRVQGGQASLDAARSAVDQIRSEVEAARVNLDLAQQNLTRQRGLWAEGLTTREALDRAENDVKLRESELKTRQQQIATQEQRIRQEQATVESARYDLSKVRIESPIDGVVTRRNIEEGETVVIGTMNNAGTVLLTIADMSIIEAEVEVDETDIPNVTMGQPAKITIDAMPDRTFTGRVTEIGNSPIQANGTQTANVRQATNFKVVVTVSEQIPDIRPGFTCTADITTATRTAAVAVPIQATTVRELIFDTRGEIVGQPRPERNASGSVEPSVSAAELEPGQTRKEIEGVFVFRESKAVFVPVTTGIAGDKYFEALKGLREGDQVITGPFASVRELEDGDPVKLEEPKRPGFFARMFGST
jgi:HlyD family secretion protein